MTQIYLVHSADDTDFAQRLTGDLQTKGLNVTTGDPDTNEQFAALHRATQVIVILSEAAMKDSKLISTLSTAADLKQKVVAIRTGPVKAMPRQLKGIPLDFSDAEAYAESFEALMDDLKPPAKQEPALPEEIQTALRNDDAVARRDAVVALGMLRNTNDAEVRDLAEQTLRDLAFRDPESNIKALARGTLQLFQGMNPEQDTSQLSTHTPMREITSEPTPPAVTAPASPALSPVAEITSTIPLWQSPQWMLVPAFGVAMAGLVGLAAENVAHLISGVLVWLLFPYINVVIRDGGRMEWDMPAPVVGGGIIGVALGVVGIFAGAVFTDIEVLDVLIAAVGGSISGGFIGWLSSLRCDSV